MALKNKVDEVRVIFYGGYGGAPKCEVRIGDKKYIIELDELEKELEDQIDSRGYTVTKTNRQKIERLVINR